ncbi:17beta hydroxysteroid dehydrogenase-like classical c SDR [Aspergillus parasiticus SU-1]|uniref:17beta hydroxysteroid dehydrogenase-like classical c SDR n=1 Tax=Aspergillus parasiticus (strain ATCC 56775 / NRRL 5862 / SRRC 143 / SU-1) TaxID=1403190 RepID=A0A0F0IK70_ASPPU|nr:17beta hydroxysteroid dehydrogenase-like classical c SDR [Aspergillus parasiticus SU-1]
MAQTTSFALITGCSSGIGKALAVAFAAQGVTVLATARRVEYLKELTSEHENIEAFELELSSPESIAKLKDAVSERTGGRLDFLVNNAGTHYASTAMDLEIEEVEKVFQVNLFAVMRLCQVFIPLLRNSPRGRIVQLGSVTRNVPMVWQAPYNASKAALSQYSKTLRLVSLPPLPPCLIEVKPFGIEVIELVTGFVQSNILHHGMHAPETSLYLPLKKTIEEIKYEGNANGMPADAYARSVVAKLVKPQVSAEIWEGVHARTLRLLVAILPLRIFVSPIFMMAETGS